MTDKMTPDQAQIIAARDQLLAFFRDHEADIEELQQSDSELLHNMASWVLADMAMGANLVFLDEAQHQDLLDQV